MKHRNLIEFIFIVFCISFVVFISTIAIKEYYNPDRRSSNTEYEESITKQYGNFGLNNLLQNMNLIQYADATHKCKEITDNAQLHFKKFNQTFTITLVHKGYCKST